MSSLIPGWPAFLRKPCTSWLIPKSIFSQHFFLSCHPKLSTHLCSLALSFTHKYGHTHPLTEKRKLRGHIPCWVPLRSSYLRVVLIGSGSSRHAGISSFDTESLPPLTAQPSLSSSYSYLCSFSLSKRLFALSLSLCLFLFLPLSGLFLSPDCLIFLSPSFSVPQIFYLTLKTLVYNYFPWWVPCARPGYLVTFPLPLPNMLSVSPCLAGSV